MKVQEYAKYYINHKGFHEPKWGETDPKSVATRLARLLIAADAEHDALKAYKLTLNTHDEAAKREALFALEKTFGTYTKTKVEDGLE